MGLGYRQYSKICKFVFSETVYVNIAIKLQGFHELVMCFRPMWTLFGCCMQGSSSTLATELATKPHVACMHLVLNCMHTTSASSQHHLRSSAAMLQHSNLTLKFALTDLLDEHLITKLAGCDLSSTGVYSQKFVSEEDKTGGLGTSPPAQRVQEQNWTYVLITIAIICSPKPPIFSTWEFPPCPSFPTPLI